MSTSLIICLIISVLTIAAYIWNKYPIGAVGCASVALYLLTGCVTPANVLSTIGNSNVAKEDQQTKKLCKGSGGGGNIGKRRSLKGFSGAFLLILCKDILVAVPDFRNDSSCTNRINYLCHSC